MEQTNNYNNELNIGSMKLVIKIATNTFTASFYNMQRRLHLKPAIGKSAVSFFYAIHDRKLLFPGN